MMTLIRKLFGLAERHHDEQIEAIRAKAGEATRISAEIDVKLRKFRSADDPLAALVAEVRRKNLNGTGH